MKNLAFLFCFLFSTLSFAQVANTDIIYLKDGSILKGEITERLEDGAIKMSLGNGREIIISRKEIKQITIEGVGTNASDYGGKTAIGVSIIGEGGIGVHFRYHAASEVFFDFNVQPDFRALTNRYNDEVTFYGGLGFGAEVNYFVSRRYKETKQKIRANGLFLRGAFGINDYPATWISAGWCSEYFKLNRFKKGFLLELGPGLQINHWADDPANFVYTQGVSSLDATILLRLQWNFFQ